MNSRTWTIAIAALCLAVASTGEAAAKHRVRHHHPAWAGPYAAAAPFGPRAWGPRMIEVRPGLIISNRDCVIDEGYGRYYPCSSVMRGW